MSEPIKKLKQTPESYSPKNKPEILNMMEENATNILPENFMLEMAEQDGGLMWDLL